MIPARTLNLQRVGLGRRSRRGEIRLPSWLGSTTPPLHHRQPHWDLPRHPAEEGAAEAADEVGEEAGENIGAASESNVFGLSSASPLPAETAVHERTSLMRPANKVGELFRFAAQFLAVVWASRSESIVTSLSYQGDRLE